MIVYTHTNTQAFQMTNNLKVLMRAVNKSLEDKMNLPTCKQLCQLLEEEGLDSRDFWHDPSVIGLRRSNLLILYF